LDVALWALDLTDARRALLERRRRIDAVRCANAVALSAIVLLDRDLRSRCDSAA